MAPRRLVGPVYLRRPERARKPRHGASSFADSSAMQRIWRDSNVAGRHAVVSPNVSYEVYGKALLGVQNDVTVLV
jgi:3-hydroxy-9,10-secoandrosta-1,3,5(10)-triene-9,17-dione monooxygenase